MPRCRPIPLMLSALLCAGPGLADPLIADDRVRLPAVEVRAERRAPVDVGTPQETENARILIGKKVTRIALERQPPVAQNQFRQLLAQAPGLLISEQPIPSHYNLNYRGLGDPHESEFVLVAVDGTPVLSDWFGYPTLYFTPPSEQLRRIDLLRGGSSLLYGPQPGPTLDLVRRGPELGRDTAAQLRTLAGNEGLRSAYVEAAGSTASSGWFASAQHADHAGRRPNADSRVSSLRGAWLWQTAAGGSWEFDVSGYRSASGEPGRLSLAEFLADPDQGNTPTNRIWIDRVDLSLAHQRELGPNTALSLKAFHGYQDRDSRRASPRAAGAPPPAFTTFDRQQFRVSGLDARALTEWGSNHSLTYGLTLYHSDSPRSQARSVNLLAGRGDLLRFAQERENAYGALFVENAFRVGDWTLVPALRQERLVMRIDEPVKLASLQRPAIDRSFGRSETLFGFGATRTLGEHWRFYGNASQGYRPMRYDDIGNPTTELAPDNAPDPARADNLELGLRGQPLPGLELDVSLFRITLEDKIEQRQVNVTDIERVNSGDARHQGLEFSVAWDALAGREGDASLVLYANGSLLDAEITRSRTPALVGRTPAYAPERLFRSGVLWGDGAGRKVALTGTHVSAHYWQDSNLGSSTLPAEIDAYTVWDLAAEWPLTRGVALVAGVQNLADAVYTSRIRSDGIEIAPRRQAHLGLRIDL